MIYDAIVVGAGPSGATTAFLLAKVGFKVAILDMKFPRRKVCGGAISPRTILLLRRLGLNNNREIILGKIHGIEMISPEGEIDTIRSNRPDECGFTTDRLIFDNHIVKKAVDAGARLFADHKVENVLAKEDCIGGVEISSGKRFLSEITVAADGHASSVMSKLGYSMRSPGKTRVCMRAIYSNVTHLSSNIELYFNHRYAPEGYGWVIPRSEDRANVGIGGLTKGYIDNKILLGRAFNWFVKEHPIVSSKLNKAKAVIEPTSSAIVSHPSKTTYNKGLIAVGEAAGFSDPLTGEGIWYAMKSAELAAHAVTEVLQEKKPWSALSDYEEMWKKAFGQDLKYGPILSNMLFGDKTKTSSTLHFCGLNAEWKQLFHMIITNSISYGKAIDRIFEIMYKSYFGRQDVRK